MSISKTAPSRTTISRLAVVFGLLPVAFGSAVVADAIDGEWCRADRSFKIEGSDIMTYGGTRMRGDYSRHGFRYTVPANEPESGAEIVMVLRGDEMLHLFKKPSTAPAGHDEPPEAWQRCRVTS